MSLERGDAYPSHILASGQSHNSEMSDHNRSKIGVDTPQLTYLRLPNCCFTKCHRFTDITLPKFKFSLYHVFYGTPDFSDFSVVISQRLRGRIDPNYIKL